MNRRAALLVAALGATLGIGTPAAAAQKITITVPSVDPDQGAFFIAAQKGYELDASRWKPVR